MIEWLGLTEWISKAWLFLLSAVLGIPSAILGRSGYLRNKIGKLVLLVLFVGAGLLLVGLVGIPLMIGAAPSWITPIEIGIVVILLFFMFVRFTIVEEGTAKIIMRAGAVQKVVMVWKGYKLDKDWNIVPLEPGETEKSHFLGGLRFVGFWPIDKVYTYKFRWTDIQLVAGKEQEEFHEKERIDYILVKHDTYSVETIKAETKPPERIPVNVLWAVTLRVKNPAKALFVAPPNWLENVRTRLNTLFRDFVSTKSVDETIALVPRAPPGIPLAGPQASQVIWKEIGGHPLIQMFRDVWGIDIIENGIEIRRVDVEKEYEEALARRRKMELEAEGKAVEAFGPVREVMKLAQVEQTADPKRKTGNPASQEEELIKEAKDFTKKYVLREMEAKHGALLVIPGVGGVERTFLAMAALLGGRSLPKRKKPEDMSDQEAIDEALKS